MSYCKIGDKPKITYQFREGQPITYQSNISPIEVTTGVSPKNSTSNYNSQGYRITFNSPQGAYGQIQFTVIDYELFHISEGPSAGDYIAIIPCGSTSFPYDANGNLVSYVITSPVVIDNTVKCPSVNSNSNICNLKILSDGKILFQAEGNCPVTFTV
ncbi:hypothetical protein, partial [Nostoc sp. 'Peltigera malacea cyanobiont' DB3992]|uniref:hypothetical protein n=1 Tax=Nostoc sp. 'Peltigera malacea cyanobiont' DB3992 TaxID=1206980 RepID=UPI000C065B14